MTLSQITLLILFIAPSVAIFGCGAWLIWNDIAKVMAQTADENARLNQMCTEETE